MHYDEDLTYDSIYMLYYQNTYGKNLKRHAIDPFSYHDSVDTTL